MDTEEEYKQGDVKSPLPETDGQINQSDYQTPVSMLMDEAIEEVCKPVCEAVLNHNSLAKAMSESPEITHQVIQTNSTKMLTSTMYPSVVSDRSYSTNNF